MKVQTHQLRDSVVRLSIIQGKVVMCEDTVHSVMRTLQEEQFGWRFHNALAREIRELENREYEVGKLSRTLDQIADLYEQTEALIEDSAEGNSSWSIPWRIVEPVIPVHPIVPVIPIRPVPVIPRRITTPEDFMAEIARFLEQLIYRNRGRGHRDLSEYMVTVNWDFHTANDFVGW